MINNELRTILAKRLAISQMQGVPALFFHFPFMEKSTC